MKEKKLKLESTLALEALRRFPSVPINSLARFLVARYKENYTGVDNARDCLRFMAGLRLGGGKKFRKCTGIEDRVGWKPEIPKTQILAREPYALGRGVWGVMADLHIPFHEIRPIETTLEWFRDRKITGIILNGDAQDCEAVSYFGATAPRDFLREVESMCDFLDLLRKTFPKVKDIIWQRGNHEDRIESYYRRNAPHLADLPTADMDTILCLKERNIRMLEKKQKITLPNFTMLHGHEMKGGYSPVSSSRWALLKAKACVSVAHFHSSNETSGSDINHKMLTAWGVGCLCHLEPDYNPYGNQWNWGAAILTNEGGDNWELDNRRILMNGKLY